MGNSNSYFTLTLIVVCFILEIYIELIEYTKKDFNYFFKIIFAKNINSFIFAPAFSKDVSLNFGEVAQLVRAQDSYP